MQVLLLPTPDASAKAGNEIQNYTDRKKQLVGEIALGITIVFLWAQQQLFPSDTAQARQDVHDELARLERAVATLRSAGAAPIAGDSR